MSKTMTPSEIADECDALSQLEGAWYADVGRKTGERCCSAMSQAAATIREIESKRCAEIESHGDTFEKYRSTSEALKIATEALEVLWDEYKALANSGDAGFWRAEDTDEGKQATQALARIKEV